MNLFIYIFLGALIAESSIVKSDEFFPNPISRVSGKSFIPNRAMNIVLLKTKAVDTVKHLSADKTLEKKYSEINLNGTYCRTCVQFANQALEELLNAIVNVGVVGECAKLCGYVADKTSSKIVGVVCNVLCDVVGIKEFVKIIEQADLDPIYYCELLKACPINDDGDAKIKKFSVMPEKGPQGTVFKVQVSYASLNGTGTGEFYIGIRTVDQIPIEESFLLDAQKPGNYMEQVTVQTTPDPECDPTEKPCEKWLPGVYFVETAICNGQCGGKHPHSQIYAQAVTNFTIV